MNLEDRTVEPRLKKILGDIDWNLAWMKVAWACSRYPMCCEGCYTSWLEDGRNRVYKDDPEKFKKIVEEVGKPYEER